MAHKALELYLAGSSGSLVKIGELQDCNPKFMTNGEQIITAEEATESTGVVTSEVSFTTAMPVAGTRLALLNLMLAQQDVSIGGLIDGSFRSMSGRLIEVDVKSTTKSGVQNGTFRFRGGKPESIGL